MSFLDVMIIVEMMKVVMVAKNRFCLSGEEAASSIRSLSKEEALKRAKQHREAREKRRKRLLKKT